MAVRLTDRFHAKQGRSTGRWVLRSNTGDLAVYLKRHYRFPWWRRLMATLWPGRGWSPALTEWRHLHWAKEHGLAVPEAVAAGEIIGPWLRLDSFLVVEELRGMLPLHEAVPRAQTHLAPAAFRQWKKAIIVQVAQLARSMHAAQHYHKDFYLCHLYVADPAGESTAAHGNSAGSFEPSCRPCVHLIDLHRLGYHPWIGYRWRIKDLAQLLFSSELPGITNRDRLRFLLLYLGRPRPDPGRRRLVRDVQAKASRYRRHQQRRSSLHRMTPSRSEVIPS
jgi:heptose I phosphotransferase